MENLFRTYYASLCYHSYHVTGDKELSEDIVQEVFVRYWQYNENIQILHPKAWLYKAVYNASLNSVEKRNTYERAKVDMFIKLNAVALEKSHELILIESETARLLWGNVEKLPPQCREIIRMGFIEGLSNKKIAELMHLHISTVKTQKQRGLSLLRKLLFHVGIWLQLCQFIFF
ncbi:RNA polymerase sigma factor [Rhizosphaericola mali]|uniref:Sigma-70 family RNA polymerase sigma factor n=1 Tax=Rhizosphaericola mali TaxID=2545455 RepID=A0A5P2FZF1_9BACT|nr:sigma-70 family RNA polymerase sigma factor [Rhizosphaericola mali]QES88906.1 sigma-70 family RNA polymerase sigma factor [Rhizosphaericola mali]